MCNPFPVGGSPRQPIQKCPCLRHRRIRMVCRKHNPINTDLKQQVEKCWRVVEPAERVMNILTEKRADRAAELCDRRRHYIKPLQHEGKRLTHVADYDLQSRITVEGSTEDN